MSLANERFQVKTYPTPLATDVLFFEVRDSVIGKNAQPAYGTPHPDPLKWPHHKLCWIDAAPKNMDGKQVWWYAADRPFQNLYNFEFTKADIGGTKFDAVRRTYIIKRSEFTPYDPAVGAAMPNEPADLFSAGHVLAERQQSRIGQQELDSLYVLDVHTYVRKATITAHAYDREFDGNLTTIQTLYYRGEAFPSDPSASIETVFADGDVWGRSGTVVLEGQQLTDNWFLVISRDVVPQGAFENYSRLTPIRVDLGDLPRELLSIDVIWNEGYSVGTQDYAFYAWRSGSSYSLGKSADDSASSAASISCELTLRFRDFATRNLLGTKVEFYLPNPVTDGDVISRVGALVGAAQAWPVFQPESETIVTTAQSISVRSNVQVSLEGSVSDGALVGQGWDRGASDDYQINVNNGAVQIPACIHGPIPIGGGTTRTRAVAATAFMSMFNDLVGSISQTKTKIGTAMGTVAPTTLSATPGVNSIPTSGLFIMDVGSVDYGYGHSKITAVVFNAAQLAPA